MFNTVTEMVAFINKNGGPSQLAQIVFNNSYVKVYGEKKQFDPINDIDTETNFIKFTETDIKGREFISYKPCNLIEALTFAPVGVDKDTINYRNFRP